MSADPVTLALVAIVLAMLRGDRQAAADMLDGLTPLLETTQPAAGGEPPQLLWDPRDLPANQPKKLLEANASPRRRVVIWNSSPVAIRVAESDAKLRVGTGGPLVAGAVLIDEPPNPHAGEWWALAGQAVTIDVAQLA